MFCKNKMHEKLEEKASMPFQANCGRKRAAGHVLPIALIEMELNRFRSQH
jgi:hypothetical protein